MTIQPHHPKDHREGHMGHCSDPHPYRSTDKILYVYEQDRTLHGTAACGCSWWLCQRARDGIGPDGKPWPVDDREKDEYWARALDALKAVPHSHSPLAKGRNDENRS